MPASRILGTAVAIVLSAVILTACSGTPEQTAPEETDAGATPTSPAPEPSSTPEPEPASTDDPTCETLVGESVVAGFEDVGWTVQESPLYIGSTEVEGGIQCMWANYENPAGGDGQMFGWAAIDAADAETAQDELVSQGWIREEDGAKVYVTESADTAIVKDENGYGMTYLFVDGHVTVSDTKQGLLLIEWP